MHIFGKTHKRYALVSFMLLYYKRLLLLSLPILYYVWVKKEKNRHKLQTLLSHMLCLAMAFIVFWIARIFRIIRTLFSHKFWRIIWIVIRILVDTIVFSFLDLTIEGRSRVAAFSNQKCCEVWRNAFNDQVHILDLFHCFSEIWKFVRKFLFFTLFRCFACLPTKILLSCLSWSSELSQDSRVKL